MTIYIFAFFLMLLLVAGMAIGAILQNKPIKGTCGGLNTLGMKKDCEVCGGDDDECEKEQERQRQVALAKVAAEDLAYDATSKSERK